MLDDEAVAKCHQLGINIAHAAADYDNAKYLGVKGICPNCNSRNFYFEVDNTAICEVCGIEGKIQISDDKIEFVFPEEMHQHAHNTIPGKMKHMDDIYRNETKLKEQKKTPEFKERISKYQTFISASVPGKV